MGTRWVYTELRYSQSPQDPQQILFAYLKITETISQVKSVAGYTLVAIHGSQALAGSSPGYPDQTSLGPLDYDYTYVITAENIYRSTGVIDPQAIDLDSLSKEFHFPMALNSAWCPNPNKAEKDFATPVTATPYPCEYAGMRQVINAGAVHVPLGDLHACFAMMDTYTSGSPLQWYCDGIGVVAEQYDHSGSRFGFLRQLIAFYPG